MLKYLLISLAVIAAAHVLGIANSWYWDYWWYDIPLHLAGGAWLGAVFYYVFVQKKAAIDYGSDLATTLILALGFVALIGLIWEFYEYFYDVFISGRHGLLHVQAGLSDTFKDLINDIIGGAVYTVSCWYLAGKGDEY